MEIINSTKEVKARKAHVCDWCGCTIPVDEKYHTQTLKGDYIYVWKNHIKCGELVRELNMDGDEGISGEDFYEYITDEFDNIWRKLDEEFYESKDFVIPEFKDQVSFVHGKRCIKPINQSNIN